MRLGTENNMICVGLRRLTRVLGREQIRSDWRVVIIRPSELGSWLENKIADNGSN